MQRQVSKHASVGGFKDVQSALNLIMGYRANAQLARRIAAEQVCVCDDDVYHVMRVGRQSVRYPPLHSTTTSHFPIQSRSLPRCAVAISVTCLLLGPA